MHKQTFIINGLGIRYGRLARRTVPSILTLHKRGFGALWTGWVSHGWSWWINHPKTGCKVLKCIQNDFIPNAQNASGAQTAHHRLRARTLAQTLFRIAAHFVWSECFIPSPSWHLYKVTGDTFNCSYLVLTSASPCSPLFCTGKNLLTSSWKG